MQQSNNTLMVSHEAYVNLLNGKVIEEKVLKEFQEGQEITCIDCEVSYMNVNCPCKITEIRTYIGDTYTQVTHYVLCIQLERKMPQQVRDLILQKEAIN